MKFNKEKFAKAFILWGLLLGALTALMCGLTNDNIFELVGSALMLTTLGALMSGWEMWDN